VPTLLALHAHPDDEAIFTGGLLAAAHAARWRTVVVIATSGHQGLSPHTELDTAAHRRAETIRAAAILGVGRLDFLDYHDSGMTASEHTRGCLATTPLDHSTTAVQSIIDQEQPALVTTYDEIGIYHHPDHLAIHAIGRRLDLPGGLLEATISRPALLAQRDVWLARGMPTHVWPSPLTATIGTDHPTLRSLDVTDHLGAKEAAISAHDSQILTAESFMGLPPGVFHALLATEWYNEIIPPPTYPFVNHPPFE
jgi:LmbE family N-acetylglucosaminyl deacetylase